MNFFESQEAARRSTRSLVGLFVLAVAGIVLAVWLAVALASQAAASKLETQLPWNPWSAESLGWVAAVTLLIVVLLASRAGVRRLLDETPSGS